MVESWMEKRSPVRTWARCLPGRRNSQPGGPQLAYLKGDTSLGVTEWSQQVGTGRRCSTGAGG